MGQQTSNFADETVDISQISSLRARNFPYSGPYPWLDQPNALEQIEKRIQTGQLTAYESDQCRYWVSHGYLILPGLIDPGTLDRVWNAYETALAAGVVEIPQDPISADDPYPGRALDPHLKLQSFCEILRHEGMLHWMRLLMGREPKPFQTIAGHKGSQQGAHSDSIHMTTYPLGYLTAAWVAFEDIHPDYGPLVYYPGSHRLPYLFADDVGISEEDFQRRGYAGYHESYEPRILQLVEEHGIAPHYFEAKKGDVLIWHANLIHGGSARRNVQLSRRAVVCHYFVEGTFAYHDLSAMESRPFSGTCLLREERRVTAVEAFSLPQSSGAGRVLLMIDEVTLADSQLNVRGWAVSSAGMDSLKISLDGRVVVTTHTGLPRPDVAEFYPAYQDDRSGFLCRIPVDTPASGIHQLVVTALAGETPVAAFQHAYRF